MNPAYPSLAHSHLGLGNLYQQTGSQPKAQERLTTATALFREMDMRFWLLEEMTDDLPGPWVKLFCTTCRHELRVHLLLVDSVAHLLELKERGAASMTLQRVRQIMQLGHPN